MANYKLHIVRLQHKYIEFYLLKKLNKNKLSKDEYLILKKCLDYKYTTEQISEMINLGYQATFQRRKNCYIRVALWFDLEVYN